MVALPITQVSPFRFLTVDDAARETGRPASELLKRAEAGKILAGMFEETLRIAVTQDGQVVEIAPASPQNGNGDDINARLSQIRREDFAHLEGVPITVSEAARKYGVSVQTLHNWIKKGYITPLKRGTSKNNPTVCNEAEIAYCAQIYEVRKLFGVRFGAPLLNADGTPYLLKHPGLSLYRRQQQP